MYDTAEHLMAGDLIIVPVSSGRHRKDDDHGGMYEIVNPPRDHNPLQVIIDLKDMWSERTAQLIIYRFELMEITRVWS